VRVIIDEQYRRARQILEENRDKLELIAQKLLELESLDAEEFVALMEGRDTGTPSSATPSPAPRRQRETEPEAERGQADWNRPNLDLPPAPSPA
jgi:cell division protease FtsH